MERIAQPARKTALIASSIACPDWSGLHSLTGRSTSSINVAQWIAYSSRSAILLSARRQISDPILLDIRSETTLRRSRANVDRTLVC
jgi:hypothetical protein